ncbi:MAG: alpha-E domain-containing protein, partial [Deltaproteobacteria bacterium]
MISRVADHCFWFGRYLERTESTARLLQVTASLALDSELTPEQCWQPVVITAGEQERFAELCGPFAAADGDAVQRYLTLDERVPVSLRRSIAAARENARSSR